jgi:hypothetical protein
VIFQIGSCVYAWARHKHRAKVTLLLFEECLGHSGLQFFQIHFPHSWNDSCSPPCSNFVGSCGILLTFLVPRPASNIDPPDLCFLNGKAYVSESLCPAIQYANFNGRLHFVEMGWYVSGLLYTSRLLMIILIQRWVQ